MTDEAFKHCLDCNIDFMYNYCPKCGKDPNTGDRLVFRGNESEIIHEEMTEGKESEQ